MGLAFLIASENLQLLSERKVLKEAEYAALLDATAVVEAARREAARIAAQAEQEAHAQREAGRAEGLAQGRAEHARRLAADTLALHGELHGLRDAMARIVVQAIGQFMDEADPAALLRSALRRVDALLRSEPFVSMRVAPARHDAARRALDDLAAEAEWPVNVALAADPALADDACIVSTASGTLEIGLDAQLAAFRQAVEGALPAGAPR